MRKQIDVTWSDLFAGLAGCRRTARAPDPASLVARHWPHPEAVVPTLSIRSGFDLLLQSAGWNPGDEVLLSELTIDDMARIVRDRGFVPVPVPIDPCSLRPCPEAVQAAITPRTRALVVAHLFGGTADTESVAQLATHHGLMLIEDCAQNYQGNDFDGHRLSTVSMFSFGSIKTNTALGTAILHVRDPELRAEMLRHLDGWPTHKTSRFATKVLKYMAIKTASYRPTIGAVARLARLFGRDHDRWVSHLVRGFPGEDFFTAIRHRPCAAQLRFLDRRLASFDPAVLEHRHAQGQVFRDSLGSQRPLLGEHLDGPGYWLLATSVDEPDDLARHLRSHGFDATTNSNLVALTATEGTGTPSPVHTILSGAVYLPFSPNMPDKALGAMAAIIDAHCPPPLHPPDPAFATNPESQAHHD